MKVMVTGGTGYIGRVLVPELVKKGYNVLVLDRDFLTYDDVKKEYEGIGVKILKDDIRYFDPTEMRGIDSVVDLAALSNDPSGDLDPIKTWDINYIGRVRVARLAKKLNVNRYIVASSCSIYGFREDIANETSEPNPLTAYAEANQAVERDNLAIAGNGFTPMALRFATAFGFSKRLRLDIAINAMVYYAVKTGKLRLMRDGEQYRPFIHVKDMASAIIVGLESESKVVSGHIFNAGSNELNIKLKDVADKIKSSIKGTEIEWYGDPDKRSYRVDFKKINDSLKFKPKYNIEYGIDEMKKEFESPEFRLKDEMITLSVYKKLIEAKYILSKHGYLSPQIGL